MADDDVFFNDDEVGDSDIHIMNMDRQRKEKQLYNVRQL